MLAKDFGDTPCAAGLIEAIRQRSESTVKTNVLPQTPPILRTRLTADTMSRLRVSECRLDFDQPDEFGVCDRLTCDFQIHFHAFNSRVPRDDR